MNSARWNVSEIPVDNITLWHCQKSVKKMFCPFIKFSALCLAANHFITQHTSHALLNSSPKCAACLIWLPAQLFDSCAAKFPRFCLLLVLMRSAELVSHSGWLFFSCWSSRGVSEVSSFLSVPLPSCLPNVSSASQRKSACQVDYFHLIKPAPCPFCLSVFPSQWFTRSVSRPLASFSPFVLSPPDADLLLDAHKVHCTHGSISTCKMYNLILLLHTERVPL